MAHRKLVVALGMIMAATPVSASQPESYPGGGAPPGTPDTKYCLNVEITGRIVEAVQCWTREEWVEQGVDVDKEWVYEGVAIIENGVKRPVKG